MATGLKYYFGIDFGTTNSATVGYVVMDQKPEAVKYGDEEGRPIPSIVAIDKTTGAVFNGRDAWDKKMELSESCEYISSVKTILDSEQVKTIAGREWTAVDVASEVFKYLKANVHKRDVIIWYGISKKEKLSIINTNIKKRGLEPLYGDEKTATDSSGASVVSAV